jgi:hypothetical protein
MSRPVNSGASQRPSLSRPRSSSLHTSARPVALSAPISLGAFLSREEKFKALLTAPVADLEQLRSLAWSGIPIEHRPAVWRLFLDYAPVNAAIRDSTIQHKREDYFDCVNRVYSDGPRRMWTNSHFQTQAQIRRDLPRTHFTLLKNDRSQQLFERVLFVWSVRHPASGYVQGMNDLLQPFFFAFMIPHCVPGDIATALDLPTLDGIEDAALREVEADCFWCFSKLLDGLQDCFTTNQPGLYRMFDSLSGVIERVEPRLAEWISSEEIPYPEFAFRWMNCLLVREFSVVLVFRIWDLYLSYPAKIASTHVYVCAAMLNALSARLTGLPHLEFVAEIHKMTPEAWTGEQLEIIMAQAYVYEQMFSEAPAHLNGPRPILMRRSGSTEK